MSTSPPAPHFTEAYAQEDNSRALRAVSVTFIILELAFVGLRYYGRAQSNEKIGVDDVLIIPSLLVVVAAPALALGEWKTKRPDPFHGAAKKLTQSSSH